MGYIITRNGADERLPAGKPFRDDAGILHAWSVIAAWSDEDLASIGVTREVLPAADPVPVNLPALQHELKSRIDDAAEAERGRYITPGAGQALTYQHKAAEALRYLQSAGAGDYPLLSAEIGITGTTLADVAAVVHGAYQAWLAIGAQIEAARLAAKAAVDAAEDEAAARAVTPVWPDP